MKKNNLLSFSFIIVSIVFISTSCKKINEATELGGNLLPPIDNINTFERFFDVITENKITDTGEIRPGDHLAVGFYNDPVFGTTHADAYFNISPFTFNVNPFFNRDSVLNIDSVVLQLDYTTTYGDSNSMQTIRVFEIAQNSFFNDTTLYKYNRPPFQTTGSELGSKTFQPRSLKDTVKLVRGGDTTRINNVLRIRLDNSIGQRFSNFDTTSNPLTGGFRNDSTFKKLFRGLAIKTDQTGNALTYFDPNSIFRTQVIVYFQVKRNGRIDTTQTQFAHFSANPANIVRTPANFVNGMANLITRTPGGEWASALNVPNSEKVFILSAPGSSATLKIPSLDTLSNNVIHRAELIISKLPSTLDNVFTPPVRLFLDKLSITGDTAFIFEKDFVSSLGLNYQGFGGTLRTDQRYVFEVSRYVQDIVTLKKPNYTLRLHAPLRSNLRFESAPSEQIDVPVLGLIANGRVVVAGGNHPDPNLKMRLRVVYSRL